MPRSLNGTSTNWAISSGSLRSGSDSWRGLSEGGSKTKVLSSSTGYNVGARAGYQFGNFRLEGEFDYANNSADTLENPRREISTDLFRRDDLLRGSTTGMTFLGNMIYDFNVPGLSGYGVTPHVLGGIGAGRNQHRPEMGRPHDRQFERLELRLSARRRCAVSGDAELVARSRLSLPWHHRYNASQRIREDHRPLSQP